MLKLSGIRGYPIRPIHRILVQRVSYDSSVIAHFESPQNIGSLDNTRNDVGSGLVGAPACGDVMKLDIQVGDDGVIIDSKFKTFGCGSAIAASSLASEWIKGKHIEDATKITNKQLAEHLKLPPVKLHCSMLAQDAISSAIRNYINKH
jgi:Fe-S cluster assembly scaffold IscU